MASKKLIGQRIREIRKQKGWKLDLLSFHTSMNISTLSKIETGDENYNASEDALEKIASALDTTLENLKFGAGNYKVGIGACIWSAPLLHLKNDDKIPSKFSLAYQMKGKIPSFDDGSETKHIEGENEKLCTARELVDMLDSRDLDIIFIPRGTYSNDMFRVCSIMNTVKGGLSILTVSQKPLSHSQAVEHFIKKDQEIVLYHSKATVAEQIADDLALKDSHAKINLVAIEINELKTFEETFIKELKESAKSATHFAYIGWEPHISYLRSRLATEGFSNINTIEAYEICGKEEPYEHIHFDCVVNRDKVDFFKKTDALKELFQKLDTAINDINTKKNFPRVHAYIQAVAKNLSMSPEDAQRTIRQINFEMTFSKEWEFHKPSN